MINRIFALKGFVLGSSGCGLFRVPSIQSILITGTKVWLHLMLLNSGDTLPDALDDRCRSTSVPPLMPGLHPFLFATDSSLFGLTPVSLAFIIDICLTVNPPLSFQFQTLPSLTIHHFASIMAESPRSTAFDDEEIVQLIKEEREYHPAPPSRGKTIITTRIYMVVIHLFVFYLLFRLWDQQNGTHKNSLVSGESWCKYPSFKRSNKRDLLTLKEAPARDFLEYEINSEHATEHTKHSKYSGTPTHAQDTAWDDLIRRMLNPALSPTSATDNRGLAMFFNASLEELQRGGEMVKNLAVVEGGGYAATIGAYHELHCLVRAFAIS